MQHSCCKTAKLVCWQHVWTTQFVLNRHSLQHMFQRRQASGESCMHGCVYCNAAGQTHIVKKTSRAGRDSLVLGGSFDGIHIKWHTQKLLQHHESAAAAAAHSLRCVPPPRPHLALSHQRLRSSWLGQAAAEGCRSCFLEMLLSCRTNRASRADQTC